MKSMLQPPSRIEQCFAQLRKDEQVALIPFLTAGDPDLETTAQALLMLDRSGADLLELGIPYSDPLADGPVIQAAASRSLARGTNLHAVLELVARITPNLRAPLILFTYYNPVLALGVENFLDRARASGASGLVIPDLPVEEGEAILTAARTRDLDIIWLVAPTSPPERLRRIVTVARGFIYLVSTTGVTGMRDQVSDSVLTVLGTLRSLTTRPVAVGFGISTPEQAAQVANWGADGVIVGSAFVQRLAETPAEQRLEAIGAFCSTLKRAMQPKLRSE